MKTDASTPPNRSIDELAATGASPNGMPGCAASHAMGSLIATEAGEIPVERLRPGDRVILATGGTASVVAIGTRDVEAGVPHRPDQEWPFRIEPGAFGPGRPARPLVLPPGHAVLVEGMLVPIALLGNGVTVRQQPVRTGTCVHVQLDRHGVLIAEGLPIESTSVSANASPWPRALADRLVADPAVTRTRKMLLTTLDDSGAMTADPGLVVMLDGAALSPDTDGGYTIPPGGRRVRLVSRAARPLEVEADVPDGRTLGVSVRSVSLDGLALPLDDARLSDGWHPAEPDHRWTDGAATIDVTGALRLVLDVAGLTRYPVEAGEPAPASSHADDATAGDEAASRVRRRLVFDLTDLVIHAGTAGHFGESQRVQSGIVLALLDGAFAPDQAPTFVSWDIDGGVWQAIPPGVVAQLLRDLRLPEPQRVLTCDRAEASRGRLPGMGPFEPASERAGSAPSVVCLLGAASPDVIGGLRALKRRFGTRSVLMVHDLVPIHAPRDCPPGVPEAFDHFLSRAVRHVDHVLAVSDNTARDLGRYVAALGLQLPPVTVARAGLSFAPSADAAAPEGSLESPDIPGIANVPGRFVLFVSAIEGRKNHLLMLDVWRRMIAAGDDPPHLVCVGPLGWGADAFIEALVESGYLGGRIVLLDDIADAALQALYVRCLFTVCPSHDEGWGLPIGDSLAARKVCLCNGRTSLPEVGSALLTAIDVEDAAGATAVIRDLIADDAGRSERETMIPASYRPVAWSEVAGAVLAACDQVASAVGPGSAVYPAVPLGVEVGFGSSGLDADCTGRHLLTRLTTKRAGYFLPRPLTGAALQTGEEIRGDGAWAQPEGWGTWLCSDRGEIVLAIPPHPDLAFSIMLKLRANGPVGELPLDLVFDGRSLWSGAIGGAGRSVVLGLARPVDADRTAWWPVRLTLRIDPPPGMLALLAEADRRVPLIGLERLVVVPDGDVATRMSILTKIAGV